MWVPAPPQSRVAPAPHPGHAGDAPCAASAGAARLATYYGQNPSQSLTTAAEPIMSN